MPRYRITKEGLSIIIGFSHGKFITWAPFTGGRDYLKQKYGDLKEGMHIDWGSIKTMKDRGFLSGKDLCKEQNLLDFTDEGPVDELNENQLSGLWFAHIQENPQLNLPKSLECFNEGDCSKKWFDQVRDDPQLDFSLGSSEPGVDSAIKIKPNSGVVEKNEKKQDLDKTGSFFSWLNRWLRDLF